MKKRKVRLQNELQDRRARGLHTTANKNTWKINFNSSLILCVTISLWGKEQNMILSDKHLFPIDKLNFIVLMYWNTELM